MRLHTTVFVLGFTALWVAGATQAQISNPIPEAVVHRGLNIEIRELARLPDSSGMHPVIDGSPTGWARISFVRDLPDGRRFANDSRGLLYLLDQNN